MNSPLVELLIQVGSLGLLAFLIWHLLQHALPDILQRISEMQERFITALKDQDDKFVAELRATREQYSQNLREIQQINIESHTRSKDSIVKSLDNLASVTQNLQVEITKWKRAG